MSRVESVLVPWTSLFRNTNTNGNLAFVTKIYIIKITGNMFRIDPLNMTVLSHTEESFFSMKQYFKYKKCCIVAKLLFDTSTNIGFLFINIYAVWFFFLDKAANLTQGFSVMNLELPGEFSNVEHESKV